MKKIINQYKKGAASFYMVAFSTLILLIIVASFASVVISQITRTTNADLAQSAYDSALAGIEDAKLAFYNYQNCADATPVQPNGDRELTCGEVVWYMQNPDCDMTGHILGRLSESEQMEVGIEEVNQNESSNNMEQAYTCVKINTELKDYRAILSESNSIKAVKAQFEDVPANDIKKVKVSWYQDSGNTNFAYTNFSSSGATFPSLLAGGKVAVPPTISISMLQTAETFSLSDFEMTKGSQTNRGTLFLVPTNNRSWAQTAKDANNYFAGYNTSKRSNYIPASGFLKSNDKTTQNKPYAVYCPENSGDDFACSATIELPEPINGKRNNDTFVFVVSLPYGQPETDFTLEFFCADDNLCSTKTVTFEDENGETKTEEAKTTQVTLSNMQIEIDSTGRANDLYRRVQARIENAITSTSLSMMGPLELIGGDGAGTGSGGGSSNTNLLEKDFSVTTEWNF